MYTGAVNLPAPPSSFPFPTHLWKSMDGGKSWSDMNPQWSAWGWYPVFALMVDPRNSNVVYAETTPNQDDYVPADVYDPNSALFQAGCCLFRSADGGASWTRFDVSVFSRYGWDVLILGIDSQGSIYLGTPKGPFRSLDGGNTWNPIITTGLRGQIAALAFDPQDPNHLFAATDAGGVFEIRLDTPTGQ